MANQEIVSDVNGALKRGVEMPTCDSPIPNLDKTGTLWKDTTIRQKLVLIYLLASQFIVFLCVSVPNPFLTKVIIAEGGVATESSLLLQIIPLAMAISSLIFGKYQIYMDSKVLLLSGMTTFIICQASFGLFYFAPNVTIVVSVGIFIRLLQGIATGGYAVSSLTIICQEFTDNISQVFGMSESLLAFGFMSGPVIGSALFSISESILLPFSISSLFVLPLVPIGCVLLGSYREAEEDKGSKPILRTLGKPVPIFIIGIALITTGGFGLINVLGSVYMFSRGFSVIQAGLGLLSAAGTYAVVSFAIGFVINQGKIIRRVLLVIGLLGTVISPGIFSPSQNMAGIFAGMAVIGLCGAFTLIGGFSELMERLADGDGNAKSNFAIHSALSGVWILALGVSEFLFPFVASEFYAVMGFSFVSLTCMAAGICFTALCSFIAYIFHTVNAKKKDYSSLN